MENLAVSPRCLAEFQRRGAGSATKGAHEIGEVRKADVIGDIGDRAVVVGQPPRGMAQSRAYQILVRGDAERLREQPQEVKRADASLRRGIIQIDLAVRIGVDPQRRLHRAAAVSGGVGAGFAFAAGNHLDKAARQHLADFVEADVAAAICCRLRQFAQHHQFRQRRHGADLPGVLAVADRFHQFGRQKERQALVAADVFVGAGIFVAGMADQHRSRHQLAELAAAVQAETALAHIGNRVTAVLLRKRLIARAGGAAEVGNRNRLAFEQRGGCHAADLAMRARWRNRQQHLEQRLAHGRAGALDREQPASGILAKLTATEQLGGRRKVG